MAIERQDPRDPNNTLIFDDHMSEAEVQAELDSLTPETGAVQSEAELRLDSQVAALRAMANPTKSNQKAAEVAGKRGSKQKQVKETSNRIKLDLAPEQATVEELRAFAATAEQRLERDDRTRSPAEFVEDAAVSVGRGAVQLGQSVLGSALPETDVSDVTENPYFQRAQAELKAQGRDTVTQEELVQERLEQRSTLIKAMQDANKLVESFNESQSAPLQARRFANQEELNQYREERKAEIAAKGELTTMDKVQTVTEEFFNTVAAYASRPSLAIDLAFENVADIVLTGGLGKAMTIPREIAEGGAEAVAKWAATEAGQKELKKRATAIGVTTTAVQEGLSAQAQVTTEIEEMSHDDLVKTSPEYTKLLEDGMSEAEAKAKLQETAGNLAFGYAGLFAGVGSKVTGGGEFSANLFNPTSRIGKTLSNLAATGRGATVEAAEETIASGGSQLAANIAKQETVNEGQDLTEGVGEAAATGAVAAGTAGGASGLAANVMTATGSVTDKAASAKKNRETKKEIETNGIENVTTDVNDPEFSIGGTLRGISARNNVEGVTQEEKAANYQEAVKVWTDYREQIDTLEVAAESAEGEQAAALTKRAEELRTEGRRYANIMSQLHQAQLETNDVEEATQQVVAGDTAAAERVLGSILIDPSSLSDENAEALLGSGNLNVQQQKAVESAREFNRAQATLENTKTGIFEGTDGFRGLNQYQEFISNAVASGNEAAADKYMADLENFATHFENKAEVASQALQETDPQKRSELLGSINLETDRISPRLVRNIQEEAKAISAMRDMMVALQGESDDTVDAGTTDVDSSIPDAVEGEVNVEPTIVDSTDEPSDSVATENTASVETEQGEVTDEQPTVSDTTDDLGSDTVVEQPVLSQRPSERDAQLTKAYLDAQKATEAVAQAEVALNEGDETVDIETLQAQEEQAYATLDALVEAVEQQNGYHLSTGLTNWKERRETAKRKTKRGQVRDANLGNEVLSNEPVERTPEEADEAFRTGNVVKEKFVPRIEEGLTSNPLQVVQNFNDLLTEDTSAALEFLDSQDELTPEQVTNLQSFAEFAADVHEAFDNTVVDNGFARADYMHYLANEDGSFDQNVKSAVALAMYNWMANKANETTFNTWEDINGILGRQDEDYVGPELQALLQDAGTVESNAINDMGKAIVKTLGIKAGPDAGGNAQTNLEQSFGLLATDLLLDSGLLKVKEVNQFELAQIVDQLDETSTAMNYNENAKIRFISLNGDVEDNEFATDSSGSNDVLGRLFKTESFRRGPVTEKPTKTVKRQKGTQQDVAQEVQDILLKHSQREHFVKKNQQKLFAQMSDEQLANMMGYKDPATVQQHLRAGVEGKNGQIMNSIKYWREFHASLDSDDTPFYFNWEQWKNQRVGIVSNTVNPQGDKLHRHLLYVGDQRQTISMDNTDLFLVGIAQGFGLDIDKQEDQTSRDQLDELVETQVMMEGIHETMKMIKNKPFQMDKILAAVGEAGEKAHSMDALVAYAEYRLALREGVDSFETDYSIEGDGVTNGPAIASLQFAVGTDAQDTKERLKRVSVNLDGDEQQFGEWKSNPLNDDNYQAIARDVEANLEALPEAESEFVGMLVGDLTSELEGAGSDVVTKAGRNLTKNPLMTAIYGSGERAIKRAMGFMLLDKFYDKLPGATEAELDRLAYLMDLTKEQARDLKKAPLDFKLTNKQEKFIVRKGAEIYGEAVYNAVNDNYASFMERRTTVNNMMQVVFELYRQQRDVLVQKKTEEAVAAGIISGTFETLPARLMAEVEKELEAAQPVMHSYFSAKTGNLNEAIYMAKSEMQVQEDSKHRTEAKRKGKKGSRNTFGRVRTPIDGGVSPTVLAVQGTDAATMLKTLDNAGVLNVHDAIFTGTANGLTDMQSINENFYNVMTEYSIVDQAETALMRALEQAELFDIANDTDIRGSSELKALLNKINGNFGDDAEGSAQALQTFRDTVNAAVLSTEAGRAETLPRITYMAQYYMENGGYETGNAVTEQPVRSEPEAPKSISYEDAYGQIKGSLRSSKKRLGNVVDVIVRKANASNRDNHKRFGEKMAQFGELIHKGTVKQALEVFEPTQLETAVNTLNTYADARPAEATVQTENQQNINPVDPEVLKAVQEANNFDNLLERMRRLEKGMTSEYRLWNMINTLTAGSEYKVEIFDAKKHAKYAAIMAESRGLHDGEAKLILLGAPDAQWSGISKETIQHEMLHAALVQRMKDSKNPDVIKAKQDLQNILTELKKHHADKFGANSLANIDELIAWTLTSAQMQEALASVDIKYENRVKSALNWMKGILTSVFGSKEPRVNNALGKTLLAVQNVLDAVTNEAWESEGPFFSDAAGFNTRDFTAERTEQVSGETLTTTFDRLGSVGNKQEGKAHGEYLRGLLGSMVGPVMTPIKLHMADAMGNTHGAITGDDVYIYTQMTQEAQPLPSSLAAAHGSKMSAQEVFAHEMTHSVLREAIDGNSRAKRELMKLFRHVKKNKLVTVEDLMDNPQNGVNSEDYKNAKATYNYVMNIRTTSDARTGKSAYLHEFAAYALTNEKFMAALSRNPVPQNVFSKDLVGDTWVQTVRNFFDTALNYVMGRLSGLDQGMNVDEAVKVLAMELAGVEAKTKHKLVQYADAAIDVVTTNLNKFTGATRNEAQKMGSVLQKSNFRLVRTAGNVLRWEYEGIVGFMEHLAQTKLLSKQGRQSFLASMITDALGRTQSTARFHDMARRKNKLLDHDRKQIEVNTAKTLNGAFDRKLNDEEKTAITKAALKTDLTKLWDFMNLGDISRVLTSRTELEQEISRTLGQLRGSKNRGFYYRASQALGYYMATGNVYEAHTLLNAENIAKMVGVAGVPKDWKKHVDLIDKLASLYAIRHTSEEHNARLAQLIAEDEHGVGFVLDMHKQMKEADKTELFDDDSTRIIKGYTRDLIDNNISVVQVPESEVEEYEKQGYVIDARLTQDKHVILDEGVVQMVNKYGGANAYAAGIISLTSKKAKGSAQTEFAPSDIKASKKRDIQEMRKARRIDPTMQRGGQLLPNVNANGTINSYRYVMNEENKERLLNRHNAFDAVMGSMAAHSLDKKVTPEVNREVIDGLREEFNTSTEPEAYIEVSPKSEDPVLREYWATLPEETKMYAKEVFGSKRIYVRRDAAPIVFGNRKLSAADLVDHDKAQRSWVREALVQFSDHHLGPKAAGRIRKAEDMWKEFVKETKEFIVVKSGIVTLMNAISNTSQLFLEGMSLTKALEWQREAYVEARRYRRHSAELFELEKQVELQHSTLNQAKARERIAELRHELATSPVAALIEDGMLQSIVEDVELADDTYSHKSQLTQKVEALTTKLPGFIRKGAKVVYMSHDSQLFKLLNEAAQLSDFVSRYALYKHKTEQGMSHNEAAGLAMDVFINYDMPTNPVVQYLNDMGVLWFTKYYFRVQKQIIRNFRENTARNLMFNVLNALTGGVIPSVIDSIIGFDTLANRVRLPDNPLDMISNSLFIRPFTN